MKKLLESMSVLAGFGLLLSFGFSRGAEKEAAELVCNTFSICALDPATGETGVAVTTRVPEVGRLCPWAKAGVGAVATQATVVVKYGQQGLDLLEKGMSPEQVIEELLKDDSSREHRQLGVIDGKGNTANYTGKQCVNFAGHRAGKNYTAQGNMLVGKQVIDATSDSFEATEGTGMELADRLIAAIEAGHKAGGDMRKGLKQSAAIIVANPQRKHYDGSNITVQMQVAEHPDPVAELRRQYDTIRQRLGYRTFRLLEGPDIRQLKSMLHELGYFRAESGKEQDKGETARKEGNVTGVEDFKTYLRTPEAGLYDVEAASAVDAFRKAHSLPVPSDGLGHARGIMDEDCIRSLKTAHIEIRKQHAAKVQ